MKIAIYLIMPNPFIKMDNVSKSYSQGESLIPVIKNIDISISDSEFTSVIGLLVQVNLHY